MIKKIYVLLLFVFCNALVAQSINNYKYALVPQKFAIFKKKPLERISVMAKLYMQNYGFETYLESETQPATFSADYCNKVFVDLIEDNTLFATKVAVVLKDCKGTVLATSPMASSRDKNLTIAYTQAVREAFEGFKLLQAHKYNGRVMTEVQPAASNQVPTRSNPPADNTDPVVAVAKPASEVLYAQPIQNGFQLVNSEPQVVYKIYKTSNSDIYAAVKGNISGVFIPKGDEWFFEYYKGDTLISEKVNVKF